MDLSSNQIIGVLSVPFFFNINIAFWVCRVGKYQRSQSMVCFI